MSMVGSGGTKFFRPDPDRVPTGLNPSRSRSRSNWTKPVPIPNPFLNGKTRPGPVQTRFLRICQRYFSNTCQMRYHSIALHAIMIFRPKCDVQVYILIFLSIRCYIKLICQLEGRNIYWRRIEHITHRK